MPLIHLNASITEKSNLISASSPLRSNGYEATEYRYKNNRTSKHSPPPPNKNPALLAILPSWAVLHTSTFMTTRYCHCCHSSTLHIPFRCSLALPSFSHPENRHCCHCCSSPSRYRRAWYYVWNIRGVGLFSATRLAGCGLNAANPRHRLPSHLPSLRRLLMDLVPYSVMHCYYDDEHALHYWC